MVNRRFSAPRLTAIAYLCRRPEPKYHWDMLRRRVTVTIAALGWLLIGCGGAGERPVETARDRMYRLAQAARIYAGDYDDTLMRGDNWMDALARYVERQNIFRSPAVPAPGYGIALHAAIAGANLNAFPTATTVLVFDSTVLTRNAVAGLDTLPNPTRYADGNVSALADGTVPGYTPLPSPGAGDIDISVDRVKKLSLGSLLYASDYDDHLPTEPWMNQISPYVSDAAAFRTPKFTDVDKYGYAFNVNLLGISIPSLDNPSATALIFDSIKTTRNATDPPTAIPNPGRYNGYNAVSQADGSTRKVRP